ncbi:MAG: hypothetical protein ACKVX7_01540 [Planctomycetota bacterium]
MSLRHECERFLEQWLVADDTPSDVRELDDELGGSCSTLSATGADESMSANGELLDHLHECVDCRKRLAALRCDQRLLASYFKTVQVPAAPRIELRDALSSASGHPRRTSLAILPFLLSVILLLLALLAYLVGSHFAQKQRNAERGEEPSENARPR